jgi:hypothetical protein
MSDESQDSDRLLVRIASGLVVVGFLVMFYHWSTRTWSGSPVPPIGWIILALAVAILPGAVHNDGPLGIVFLLISTLASVLGALLLTVCLSAVLISDADRFEIVGGLRVAERSLFDRIMEQGKDGSLLMLAGFWLGTIANSFTLLPFLRDQLTANASTQDQPPKQDSEAKPVKPTRRCPSCGKKIAVYAQACKHCKTILTENTK